MRKVSVDEFMFIEAFQRDVDFEQYFQSRYLDLETGEIIWVFGEDEDADMWAGIDPDENASFRNKIEANPERYLEIPGRNHGGHHEILRDFLNSNWTDNENLLQKAQNAYFGSIGGWKEEVDTEDAVRAYYDFRDQKIKEMAEKVLCENNIYPIWR